MRLRPVPGAAQPPAVDDVADQEDRLRLVVPEEVDQKSAFAALDPRCTSEMKRVRNCLAALHGHPTVDGWRAYALIHATGV